MYLVPTPKCIYYAFILRKENHNSIFFNILNTIPPQNLSQNLGIPGWCSGLAPAFGPGHDPGDPGSNPTSGSWCMEPASPSAYVSAPLSLSVCDYHKEILKNLKKYHGLSSQS